MSTKKKIHKFLVAFEEILNDPSTVILTDKDIYLLACSKLAEEDRPSLDTFLNWKNKTRVKENPSDDMLALQDLLEIARVKQKLALGKELLTGGKASWAITWVLERKFDELNLKKTVEVNNTNQPLILVQNAGDANLINQLMKGDIIDIDHLDVTERPKIQDNNSLSQDSEAPE